MPDLEHQNTRDIRYVDEKLDKFKTDFNKVINKQGQELAKVGSQLVIFEKELENNTNKLETKITKLQNNLTDNLNQLTVSITKLTLTQEAFKENQEAIQETLKKLVDIQETMKNQDLRLEQLEGNIDKIEELKKEKIKANSAIIVAVISGVLTVLGTILMAVFAR